MVRGCGLYCWQEMRQVSRHVRVDREPGDHVCRGDRIHICPDRRHGQCSGLLRRFRPRFVGAYGYGSYVKACRALRKVSPVSQAAEAVAAGGIAADSGRAAGAGDVSGVVANAGDSNGAGAASDAGRTILQAHGIAGALRLFARKVAKPGSRFRPFVGAHLLSMGIYLISPFIFLYAWNEMGLTARDSGLVVCAEMAGLLLGSIAAGRLGERSGSGAVVRLSCIASAGVPLFAMLSGFLPATSLLPATSRAVWGLAAVTASMVCMGVFQASSWAGGTGYVVERTNEQDRPIVIAMLNFLVLPFLCLSPVGGLAIKQAGYIPVFAAAVVPCLGSAVLALKVD